MRGTFANIRIRNEMVPGIEGGYTRHIPSQNQLSIYDAAMQYQQEQVPLAVIAGKSTVPAPAATGRRRGRACWGFGW